MEHNPELGADPLGVVSGIEIRNRRQVEILRNINDFMPSGSTIEIQFVYQDNWRTLMNRTLSIRPSKDIRTNYAKISALTRENPVAITVNGKEDTVLLSHEDFMEQSRYISELEARLAVYAHLAQGMDDVKLGRVSDLDEAFDDVLKDLEDLEL